jgi:hypothetical protein
LPKNTRLTGNSIDENFDLITFNSIYHDERHIPSPSLSKTKVHSGSGASAIPKWVVGKLVEVNLDKPPRYEALSYTWDAENDSGDRFIILNEKPLPISGNCAEALLRLRHRSWTRQHRCLWIDAICIDQTSIPERNHQVALMGEIYRKATRVVVWLGEGDNESDAVAKRLNLMEKYNGGRKQVPAKIREECMSIMAITGLQLADQNIQDSSRHWPTRNGYGTRTYWFTHALLDRRWFQRIWTVQEFAMARQNLMLCGNASFTWSTIMK